MTEQDTATLTPPVEALTTRSDHDATPLATADTDRDARPPPRTGSPRRCRKGRGRSSGASAAARAPSPACASRPAPARSRSTAASSTTTSPASATARAIFGPLEVTNTGGKMDVFVNTNGGGPTGQAGAIVMGLGRALLKYDPTTEVALRDAGFLTRDSRMKERKKYGQRGARRRFQFSKR